MTNETSHSVECDNLKAQIKQLKNELDQVTNDLLKHEYEGGMAEMSVGVLHNIGNTLTPSKIAISMLLQRLDKSPLRTHLKKILQPLENVIPDSNLPENEKQKLLKIIQILPGSLEEEYEQNILDVEKIRDKQEHIASIIALHMRYSHLKVDYCEVSVSRIIDDAVSIQSESISKRKIEIIKEIEEIPYIKIQESKLLQIFVNLLKNAYESIDLNPESNKQICLKAYVDENSNNQVIVKIKDTGIGFSAGAEKNFFDFGYTSKSEGSGFGLHFCANFLKSIDGHIIAQSEGEGKGAEFTIYLPIN
ncbi:MAG: HAMP domain-containing histidine kinase [Gammaproteobacteria bacterium]|nr:HAMP domain-containing histidine kinase [Gammaproteobacteria bacterium]